QRAPGRGEVGPITKPLSLSSAARRVSKGATRCFDTPFLDKLGTATQHERVLLYRYAGSNRHRRHHVVLVRAEVDRLVVLGRADDADRIAAGGDVVDRLAQHLAEHDHALV